MLSFDYNRITLEGCRDLFEALGGGEGGAAVVPDGDSETVNGYID